MTNKDHSACHCQDLEHSCGVMKHLLPMLGGRLVGKRSSNGSVADKKTLTLAVAQCRPAVPVNIIASRGAVTALRCKINSRSRSARFVEGAAGYIAMEVAAGNYKEARSLYRRFYSRHFEENGQVPRLAYSCFSVLQLPIK